MKLSENFGELTFVSTLAEGITKEQLSSAISLVGILEKLLKPVAQKMPKTTAGVVSAKKIILASTSKDIFTQLAGKITPNILKPLTNFNQAVGFISALAQGMVQSSELYTSLSDIQEENVDTPIGKLMDKTQLFKQLRSIMTPDGFLGFMQGMPIVSANDVAREMMNLSLNEFKAISQVTEELKSKKIVAQKVGETTKQVDKEIKQTEKAGAKMPEETNNITQQQSTAPVPQASPKMTAFSRKKYARALYTAVRKIVTVDEKQIETFINNIAKVLEKQNISIAENRRLGAMFGTMLQENLTFDDILSAASAAGINDEDSQIVIGYKLAKMISDERISDKSGALPKVFPKDFKITAVPVKHALSIISAHEDKQNAEFWKNDTEAQKNVPKPQKETLPVMMVSNPYGHKGKFIPLNTRNPISDGIIVQGRDPKQENTGDDYEYNDSSSVWYIDVEKLMRNLKGQMTAQTESVPEEEQKTVVHDRKRPSEQGTTDAQAGT